MRKFASTFLFALASQAMVACGGGGIDPVVDSPQIAEEPGPGEKTVAPRAEDPAPEKVKSQQGETMLYATLTVSQKTETEVVRKNSFVAHNLDTDSAGVLDPNNSPRLRTEEGRLFVDGREWDPQAAQPLAQGAPEPAERLYRAAVREQPGTKRRLLDVTEHASGSARLVASFEIDDRTRARYDRILVDMAFGVLYIAAHVDGADALDLWTYDSDRGARLVDRYARYFFMPPPAEWLRTAAIDAGHDRVAVAIHNHVVYFDLARGTQRDIVFNGKVSDVALLHLPGDGASDPAENATELPEVQPSPADEGAAERDAREREALEEIDRLRREQGRDLRQG